jgi:hypothetical protein
MQTGRYRTVRKLSLPRINSGKSARRDCIIAQYVNACRIHTCLKALDRAGSLSNSLSHACGHSGWFSIVDLSVTLFIKRRENQFQNKFHVVKIHLFGIILLCPSYDHRLICSGSGWPQDHPHMIVDIIDRHIGIPRTSPAPRYTTVDVRTRVIDADGGEQRWTGDELADGRL